MTTAAPTEDRPEPSSNETPDGTLRAGVAVDSDEALRVVATGFRQIVAYLVRQESLAIPISPEARLAEQVALVLAVCAARGSPGDKRHIREIYDFVYKLDLLRPMVLDAVTKGVDAPRGSNAQLEVAATTLREELREIHHVFERLDPKLVAVLLAKAEPAARGAGKYSSAKVAAALCLDVEALGATKRSHETLDAARTRIAKSFRSTRRRSK